MNLQRGLVQIGEIKMTNIYEKLRNLVLIIFSIVLWIFCLMAILTILLSILKIDTYYIQLIRILMNINTEDIQYLALILVYTSGIILFYLFIAGYLNRLTYKDKGKKAYVEY